MKPLNRKNYGSIPHLSNSKLGTGDHFIEKGQERILTEKVRDKHDEVLVFEKYEIMKNKILEILTLYEVNEENQSGVVGGVIWDNDFSELADDLVKFCNLQNVSNNEVALKAFVEEFVEAWDDGMGGDTDLYRKAKSLL